MPKRELISLFTDAGYDSKLRLGSWGFWAKRSSRERSVWGGGRLRPPVPGPAEAEAMAVANALASLTQQGFIEPQTHILIQTDNLYVVRMLNQDLNPHTKTFKKLSPYTEYIVDLAKTTKFSFNARHVKGHVSKKKGASRHAVNNICDDICRRHLQSARMLYRNDRRRHRELTRTEQPGD